MDRGATDLSAQANQAIRQASMVAARVVPAAQAMIAKLDIADGEGFPAALPQMKAFLKALDPALVRAKRD